MMFGLPRPRGVRLRRCFVTLRTGFAGLRVRIRAVRYVKRIRNDRNITGRFRPLVLRKRYVKVLR